MAKTLTVKELKSGISETKKAIQRGRKLFKSASSAGLTEGLSKVVESTPKLMEELEEELAILEVEIKSKNKKP
jgi:hypothetical protein